MHWRGLLTPKRCLKAVLSVFIVYHLTAIMILPMGSGLLIRELGRYFISYANIFDLNTSWVFFSPGPSPIFYLEYRYTYPSEDDDDSLIESEAMLLPEKRVGFGISDFYNRRLYSMRFLSLDPQKMERLLVPWLCRKDPKAESVSVREIFGEVQSVELHRGKYGGENFTEMTEPKRMPRQTFHCERPV
jgi:hypothetical protein